MEEPISSNFDEQLLAGLQVGDTASVERLYRLYFPMVAKYVLLHKGTMEDAQDVFQEVLLVLHRYSANPQFKLISKLSTLIYSISRNQWQNHIKVAARQQVILGAIAPNTDAGQEWDEEAVLQLIQTEIEALSPECRQMLDLFYFDRASMDTIAAAMGYSQDFVKVKKFRCLDALRKAVKAKLGWK